MKVRALGLVCLISGALAVPVVEQQMRPQEAPAAVLSPAQADMQMNSDMMMGHGNVRRAVNILSGNVNMNAFAQMVQQVQQQVQEIEQLVHNKGSDPNALIEALVGPMSHINQTLATGVSRLDIGSLLSGAATNATAPAQPLGLLHDLLESVVNLLNSVLTHGPIGDLLNGLLGGVLGGVGSTVGGVLGGAGTGAGAAAAQVPDLISSILGSVGSVLPPAAGAAAGAVPGAAAAPVPAPTPAPAPTTP
ncbi:274873ec-92b4-4fb5-8977-44e51a61e207 [Thermothielavioides terrestris]|uniref:274873ec-92b4-4fb5-8977-44e51a61e207 n=1 Tax=Thermothielavioides terrestris TaxID=2587410 RepID=A0A446B8A8_9PEZI|nr:274873ec-92b4-4fb5-8977-44e51a61e207 [Thermothielavioides terrestris]